MWVATLQFATYDKLPPAHKPVMGYTPVITHRSVFVFLMHNWINLVYFWDTIICTWAQLIKAFRTMNHNLLFDQRLTSQHWTVNHQPLFSDRRRFICGEWELRLRSSLFWIVIQRFTDVSGEPKRRKKIPTNPGWRTRRAKLSHLPRRMPEMPQPLLLAVMWTLVH